MTGPLPLFVHHPTVRRSLAVLAMAAACLQATVAATASAQASNFESADASYGKGVRAYHSGQLLRAESYFNQSLNDNPNDPRLFYYRAALLRRQGRYYEAEAEARTAATLEANGRGGAFNVGRALERLQGSERLFLERIRRETRKALSKGSFPTPPQRAPHATPGRRTALKAPFRLSLDMLASAESPQDLARLVAKARQAGYQPDRLRVVVEDDPFIDDPLFNAEGAEATAGPAEAMADPFGTPGDDATPDSGAVSDDPFGTSPTPSDSTGDETGDDAMGDPFAGPADEDAGMGSDDPFAEDSSDEQPALEDDPFANPF